MVGTRESLAEIKACRDDSIDEQERLRRQAIKDRKTHLLAYRTKGGATIPFAQ